MVRHMISARGRLLAGTALTGMVLAFAGSALANPADPTVVSGTVGFTANGSVLEVQQGSDKAIIDWRGFTIAAGETTRFVQPGTGSVALNRVTGGQASSIDGALTANGRIFLINPNGILFGAGATVDVGTLVATTADIANDRFLAGDYRFDIASPVAGATIANAGTINAGIAALVAPQVRNSGTIQATLGSATLGAAQRFTLDLAGDGLISFDASSAIDGARIVQSGLVRGSSVLLSASTAARVVDTVIDMSGVVEARSARQDGGDIVLDGGQGGVALGGTLDNSAAAGGDIRIQGPVTLTADTTLVTAGNAGDDIRVAGTVNGPKALIADAGKGAVTFDSAVGGSTALTLLSAGGSTVSLKSVTTMGLQDYAGSVTLAGDLVSTVGGSIRVGGPLTLAADSVLVTAGNGGDDVKVTGTINGPYALVVDAGKGKVALDGAVGGSNALKLLSAGGSTVSLKSVTTTGLQDYASTVTLAGDLVSTVGGSIRVGGSVTLAADSVLVSAGNGGDDVKVTGTINGPYALVVDAGKGKVALDGAVGGSSALKLLSAGGSTVSLKSVTTTGLQDYAGTVTLAGDLVSTVGGSIRVGGSVTLAADSVLVSAGNGGDDVKVTGTINGPYALVVDAGKGKVALDGAVGGSNALKLLSAGGSTVSLKSVTTTGLQDYAGAVSLAGDLVSTVGGSIRVGGSVTLAADSVLVTAGNGGDDVKVTGTINGPYALVVDAGKGKVALDGAVGGSNALKLLSAGGSTVSLTSVTTTGLQDYAGTLTLAGDLVSTVGGSIRVGGPLTLAADSVLVTAGNGADDVKVTGTINGPYALVVDAGKGKVALDGAVGGSSALKLLSAGGSTVSLKSVTTTGLQDYAGSVTLAGDLVSTVGGSIRIGGPLTLAADSVLVSAGNGGDDVKVTGTINGPYALVVDAGKGKVALDGAVGGSSALKLLSAGGSTVSLKSVTTTGLQDYAGTVSLAGDLVSTVGGSIRVGGPLVLASNAKLATAGAGADNISLEGPVSGAYQLAAQAGQGAVTAKGAVNGLNGLDVAGGLVTLAAPVSVTGALGLAGTTVSTGALSGRSVVLTGTGALTAGALVATDMAKVTAGKTASLAGVTAGQISIGAGDSVTAGALVAAKDLSVTAAKAVTLTTATADTITVVAGDMVTANALTAVKNITVTGAKAVSVTDVAGAQVALKAGSGLALASLTADAASLTGGTVAGTGILRVKGVLLIDTAGRASLSDVQVGGLTYRGAGIFNANGSVAGIGGADAADLVIVQGGRFGTYLFAGQPVFGITSIVERHRLDIPLAQTMPATDRDDDPRVAAPVLDPARAAGERDPLIEIRD